MAGNDYDNRDDDRPRRRRDDDAPPKKKGCSPWVIVLGVCGLFGLICVGGVALIIGSVFSTLAAAGKPTDEFLTLLGNGDTAGAYQSAASGLRAADTLEEFDAFVKSSRLDQYQTSNWNKFNFVNDQGTLEGTVTLKDGSTIPLKVDLVNEGGWKVLGLELTGGGTRDAAADRLTVPDEAELKRLVNRDMSLFHIAVESDDFTALHGNLSDSFQEEKTPDELREVFKVFVEKKIDFSPVEKVAPELTKPATIDGNGVLEVVGKYPSRPAVILFTLRYISQRGVWRLVALNVETKAAE